MGLHVENLTVDHRDPDHRPYPILCRLGKHKRSEYRETENGMYRVARCERECGWRNVRLQRPVHLRPGEEVEIAWKDPWYEVENRS